MAPQEGKVEYASKEKRDDGYQPDDESEEHAKQNGSLLSIVAC